MEGLGQIGKADLAVQMVKQMEQRGMVAVPGVYYALAATLCVCGKWQDALLQVNAVLSLIPPPPPHLSKYLTLYILSDRRIKSEKAKKQQ